MRLDHAHTLAIETDCLTTHNHKDTQTRDTCTYTSPAVYNAQAERPLSKLCCSVCVVHGGRGGRLCQSITINHKCCACLDLLSYILEYIFYCTKKNSSAT